MQNKWMKNQIKKIRKFLHLLKKYNKTCIIQQNEPYDDTYNIVGPYNTLF